MPEPRDPAPAADDAADAATKADRPVPPPSGVDLARSVLAAARARSRDAARRTTTAPVRRRATGARSGAGPDERDPQPLGATLRRLVADRGWETDVATGSVIGRWADVVGAELAAHVRPESFVDGVLTVRAETTAWATQVRLLTASIVARVEESSGAGSISRLVVLGPDVPSWRRGGRSVRGRGPRDTYG